MTRRLSFARSHLHHHARFDTAAVLGLIIGVATSGLEWPLRLLLAGDSFFVIYLASTLWLLRGLTAERLRQRAAVEDEGMLLIALIALGAIGLSLGSIFMLVHQPDGLAGLQLALAVASVPLGWLTLHTIAALQYANRYYTPGKGGGDAGGLGFPGDEDPDAWDFLYYSFVVGMTSQVSDVAVRTSGMRRVTLAHGIVAFFYNTVLVALAVNIAAAQA